MPNPPFSTGHNTHLVDSSLVPFGTSGNPIFTSVTGAGSGGTSSVDKAAFTAASSAGTAAMGVVTPTDTGLAANLLAIAALDANRNLCVNVKAGSGSGVSVTDSAAWTAASSVFVPNGGVFNDSATALTAGQQGTVRSTANRALHTNIRNTAGAELATLAAPLRTDPTGTTTQPVSGTVTANAGSGTFTDQHSDVELDYDSGAGTQNVTVFGIALPASGGAVAGGTATNPLQVSLANTAANTTAIKVDGSAVTQPISAASLPLPSGASTAAKQPALGSAGSASADVITIQGIASMTKLLVTPDSVALPANQSVNLSQVAGTATDTNSGNKSAGTVRVVLATDQPALTNALLTTQTPATSGGLSISRTLSAANTTGINAKASAGQVFGFIITNTNAAVRYVKLYNKASAPTVGTDTPVITLAIPGNTAGAGMVAAEYVNGIAFGTGIGYGITTGVADNDTGAPAANEVIVNLFYK